MEVRAEEVLSPEEARRMIDNAEEGFFRTLFLTAYLTDARHDELSALRWIGVDLEAGKLVILRSLSWAKLKGEPPRARFYEPKTKAGRRTLPIAAELVHTLKVWKVAWPKAI